MEKEAVDPAYLAPADVAAPPADAEKSPTGLATKKLRAGTGNVRPGPGDRVRVDYTGWTSDGDLVYSTVKRGRPTSFWLKNVIPGWSQGIQQMVVGEKRRIWIPAELGFDGSQRRFPEGDVVFDMELLKILERAEKVDAESPKPDEKKTAKKSDKRKKKKAKKPKKKASANQ